MEQENATPTGAFESGSSARSNAINQIAKAVNEQYAPEMSTFNEETGEIGPKGQPAAAEPVQAEAATDAVAEPVAQDAAPAVAEDLETIVIDGQERKVKRDQVLDAGRRTLQKEAAADRRLEEAAETLRRAKAYEQGIMQRQPSSDAGYEQPPSQDAANRSDNSARNATPDIGTLVDQRLWIHDATKAARRFQDEYKDLADDPLAARLVSQLESERLAKAASEGSPLGDPWDAYKAHGDQVRTWLGKAKPAEPVQVSADKTERKRETVTVTGSTTRSLTPAATKPLSVSDVIEQQRQARMKGRPLQPTR